MHAERKYNLHLFASELVCGIATIICPCLAGWMVVWQLSRRQPQRLVPRWGPQVLRRRDQLVHLDRIQLQVQDQLVYLNRIQPHVTGSPGTPKEDTTKEQNQLVDKDKIEVQVTGSTVSPEQDIHPQVTGSLDTPGEDTT